MQWNHLNGPALDWEIQYQMGLVNTETVMCDVPVGLTVLRCFCHYSLAGQLVISYGLLVRIFTYQPTVDKTIVLSTNC